MATPTGTVFTVTDLSGATYNLHGVLYGECTTAAATQAKVVSIPGITSLIEGLSIRVRFQYAQTYNGAPTLNVNSLGAKTIRRSSATNAARYEWVANEILDLVYDGTYWVLVDGGLATTSYYGVTKLTTSATSTNTATALTPGALNNFAQNVIANYPVFSTSATYEVGDRVRYSWNLWECKTAITTAGAWDADYWTELPALIDMIESSSGGLPDVTASDNGKILQVVNGAWAAASLPTAEGVSF